MVAWPKDNGELSDTVGKSKSKISVVELKSVVSTTNYIPCLAKTW
jgi:hypothetical protein